MIVPMEILIRIEENFAKPTPQLYLRLSAVNKSFESFFLSDALWEKFNVYNEENDIFHHYLDICEQDVEQRKQIICSTDPEHRKPEDLEFCTSWFDAQLQKSDNTEFRQYMMSGKDEDMDLYSQLEYIREFDNLRDERVLGFHDTVWIIWRELLDRETRINGVRFVGDEWLNIPPWLHDTRDAYMDLARSITSPHVSPFRRDKEVALTRLMALSRLSCLPTHYDPEYCFDCFNIRKTISRVIMRSDPQFFQDRDVVLAAASCSDEILIKAAVELKSDKQVVMTAVAAGNPHIYAAPALRNDPEVILEALRYDGPYASSFPHWSASLELLSDKNFILEAVSVNGFALKLASGELQDCNEVVLSAVSCKGLSLEFASQRLRGNKDIVLAAVSSQGGALKFASPELQDCDSIVEAAVISSGTALRYASLRVRANRAVVLAAVTNNGDALEITSGELKHDRQIIMAAVSTNTTALSVVPISLRFDREIMLAAVSNSYYGLVYSKRKGQGDREIVLAAVSNSGFQLKHASRHLRDDYEVVLAAVSQGDSPCLKYASQRLQQNIIVACVAAMSHPKNWEYIAPDLRENLSFRLAVMRRREHELIFSAPQ